MIASIIELSSIEIYHTPWLLTLLWNALLGCRIFFRRDSKASSHFYRLLMFHFSSIFIKHKKIDWTIWYFLHVWPRQAWGKLDLFSLVIIDYWETWVRLYRLNLFILFHCYLEKLIHTITFHRPCSFFYFLSNLCWWDNWVNDNLLYVWKVHKNLWLKCDW